MALWLYLDLTISFIAVPFIKFNLFTLSTYLQAMSRELCLLLLRAQLYEAEYGQKTELSTAEIIKKKITGAE